VIDGGLAVLDGEGCGFEEDVGLGGLEPVSDVCRFLICFPAFRGRGRPLHTGFWIKAIRISDPSQAAGCYSGDAEVDSVAVAKFGFAVTEQLREGAVDVAEAEEAEVVGANSIPPQGLKPCSI
jgi:hypothetical protein